MKPLLILVLILSSKFGYSQNVKPATNSLNTARDQFVFGNNQNEKWTAYKKAEDSTYYILDENKNTIYTDLKYFTLLENSVQILDKRNEIEYLDRKSLKLLSKAPDNRTGRMHCGNEPAFSWVIEKSDTAFEAYQITDMRWANGDTVKKKKLVATIPFTDADEAAYKDYNGKEFLESDRPAMVLVFKKNGTCGVWDKTKLVYDEIILSGNFIKLEKNNLYSYLQINKEPKYTELADFEFGLARMKLPSGKTGYIDNRGREYFDN